MTKQQKGFIVIAVSSIGLGTLGLWSKLAYDTSISPLELLTLRFTFSAVLLWGYGLIRYRKELYIGRSDMIKLFIQGGLAYALTSIGYFYSLKYLPVSLTAILFYLHPVYTFVLSKALFKEDISLRRWGALLATFLGILLLVGVNGSISSSNLIGIAIIILSSLSYSVFVISNQALKTDCNGFISTLYSVSFCALTMNIVTQANFAIWFSLNSYQWIIVFGIAFLGTIIGIYGLVLGIGMVGASAASIYSAIEPLSATIMAVLLLKEHLTLFQGLGMLLVFAGVSIIKREQKAKTKTNHTTIKANV